MDCPERTISPCGYPLGYGSPAYNPITGAIPINREMHNPGAGRAVNFDSSLGFNPVPPPGELLGLNPDGSAMLNPMSGVANCHGPDIPGACELEFTCSNTLAEVPTVTVSPGPVSFDILWEGVTLGDDLRYLVKDTKTNIIIAMGAAVDVEAGGLGVVTVSETLLISEYMVGMFRIDGNDRSVISTHRFSYTGVSYDIIIDGTAFVVDGVDETLIID